MKLKRVCGLLFLSIAHPLSLFAAEAPGADEHPFAGTFTDGKLTVEMTSAGEGYTGTLTLNGDHFPASAHVKSAAAMEGAFESGDNRYTFKATLAGDTLTFVTDATTYKLTRSAHAMPGAPLPGYFVMASTPHGQAWGMLKRESRSAKEILSTAARELRKALDAKAVFGKALVDEKDEVGTVSFKGVLQANPVGGKILCTSNSFGVMVSVVFQGKDGDAAGWEKLSASIPTVPVMQLAELPGGTGTIALPEDWKITWGDPAIGNVVVEGPQGERVQRQIFVNILTPEGFQNSHPLRPPGPEVLISKFLPPAEALQWVVAKQRENPNLKATVTIDRITENKAIEEHNPADPKAQKAALTIESTKHIDGKDIRQRSIGTISTMHNPPFGWNMCINSIDAPAAIFPQRLLLMMEIYRSYTVDMQAVSINARAKNDQTFRMSQDQLKAMKDRFNATQATFRDAERARHAGAMRTVELIRGVRAMDDTKTGTRTWEDLSSIDKMVASRNAAEGSERFKETPLEMEN